MKSFLPTRVTTMAPTGPLFGNILYTVSESGSCKSTFPLHRGASWGARRVEWSTPIRRQLAGHLLPGFAGWRLAQGIPGITQALSGTPQFGKAYVSSHPTRTIPQWDLPSHTLWCAKKVHAYSFVKQTFSGVWHREFCHTHTGQGGPFSSRTIPRAIRMMSPEKKQLTWDMPLAGTGPGNPAFERSKGFAPRYPWLSHGPGVPVRGIPITNTLWVTTPKYDVLSHGWCSPTNILYRPRSLWKIPW